MSVSEAVYTLFSTDTELTSMVPGGVHTIMALEGETPRIILSFEYSTLAGGTLRGGFVNVDIFDRSNDLDRMEQIRDRVIELADRVPLQSTESGPTLRLYVESDGPNNDPNVEIGLWSVSFGLRFLRNRLKDW